MNQQSTIQFPPEWALQSGIMLTWPHEHGDWQPLIKQVEPVFCEITYHCSLNQKVLITCYDESHRKHIRQQLQHNNTNIDQIYFFIIQSNDSWVRDHGPITINDSGKPTLLDFEFNGWGGKFESKLDNAITKTLHQRGAFGTTPCKTIDIVLEGGSIDTDGLGTLLTTRNCLLSPKRNPQLTQIEIEQRFKSLLGISRTLWLEHGDLIGDDTDSHIDTLARFCSPSTIAYSRCDDVQDEHFASLQAMEEELKQFRNTDGQPYTLVPLPIPKAIYNSSNNRLPATYANFLIINNTVLVPTYDDENDKVALQRLADCFPDRKIIAINCRPLIEQYGSLHCVTMQLPTEVLE